MVAPNHRFQMAFGGESAESAAGVCDMEQVRNLVNSSVEERPMAMALAAFGVGIAVGIGLCSVITEAYSLIPCEQPETLADRLNRMLPQALARHFGKA